MSEKFVSKNVEQPGNKLPTEDVNNPARRLHDEKKLKSPAHSIEQGRRMKNRERRSLENTHYHGTARRYTIDRRLSTKDRRNVEE